MQSGTPELWCIFLNPRTTLAPRHCWREHACWAVTGASRFRSFKQGERWGGVFSLIGLWQKAPAVLLVGCDPKNNLFCDHTSPCPDRTVPRDEPIPADPFRSIGSKGNQTHVRDSGVRKYRSRQASTGAVGMG
jgi:hypothetical protein